MMGEREGEKKSRLKKIGVEGQLNLSRQSDSQNVWLIPCTSTCWAVQLMRPGASVKGELGSKVKLKQAAGTCKAPCVM